VRTAFTTTYKQEMGSQLMELLYPTIFKLAPALTLQVILFLQPGVALVIGFLIITGYTIIPDG
jgi:hypothetical protein